MKTLYNKKSDTSSLLSIELSPGDYQEEFAKRLKEYSHKASIKGFRSNAKAKSLVIERLYGAGILKETVLRESLKSAFDYVEKEGIVVLGEIKEDQELLQKVVWENGASFSLVYPLDVVPSFSVDLDKLTATKYQVGNPSTAQIMRAIDVLYCMQSMRSKVETEELQEESMVYGDILDAEGKEQSVFLHVKPSLIERIGAKGKKLGEEILLPATETKSPDFDCHHLLWAEDRDVTLTIRKIVRMDPKPLDQAFFDSFFAPGTVSSEEELKQIIKKELLAKSAERAEQILHNDVKKLLLKETKISLPENYQKEKEGVSWNLIMGKLAKENKIAGTQEEIVQELIKICKAIYGGGEGGGLTLSAIALVQNSLQEPHGVLYQEASRRVVEKKVFAFIKDKITINSKKISSEKFAIFAVSEA